MKLTQKSNTQIKSGMTLIELTVVIIVLLTLISVLFFAGTAYIKASNRTACMANQATFQKAVRGYATLNQVEAGKAMMSNAATPVALTWVDAATAGFIGDVSLMVCPTAKTPYIPVAATAITNPIQGVQVAPCLDVDYKVGGQTDPADDHVATDLGNW